MRPHYSLVLFAAVAITSTADAQTGAERSIEQYVCMDVMRDAGAGREVAVAFLHGYLLGKSGDAKFNLEVLARQTDAFIERCLSNPTEKAIEAMMTVKK
jgi:hypothetical protein